MILAIVLGLGTAAGLLLIVSGSQKRAPIERPKSVVPLPDRLDARLLRAVALGLSVAILTRWPVASLASAVLGWFSIELLGGRAAREAGVTRTEAIATWTEMLRDTISAAHGLEAAIHVTATVAPEAIRPEVLALSISLERESLPSALHRLAADLAHPIGDLVAASLSVAAVGSVRDLSDLLGTLAASARDDAAMQLRVEAARARMRTAVRVITGCTVVTAACLVALNPSYVMVYSSAVGQTALALIAICWGLALWWLARMSQFRTPERFLLASAPGGAAEAPA